MINPNEERRWQRARRCTGGNCVEVMRAEEDVVLVRNSTNPDAVLSFTTEEWETFLRGVKEGDFSS
ncbi:DUF397 domain-containing protein [Paractinoplanes maris]|uniref:DUF397 domain-containing protein n=1 Tax=Paractinoplanes maris TaxID=1734446 RepID=UPI0020225E66|nr:DUF397 domain-containing protein [Actinoplanes maris]